jgi:hypothetical protein
MYIPFELFVSVPKRELFGWLYGSDGTNWWEHHGMTEQPPQVLVWTDWDKRCHVMAVHTNEVFKPVMLGHELEYTAKRLTSPNG